MNAHELMNSVNATPWAMMPQCFPAFAASIREMVRAAPPVAVDDTETTHAAARRMAPAVRGSVGVISVRGVMMARAPSWMESYGIYSTERIGQVFKQAIADESIGAVVFDIDSPGGSVLGLEELSQTVFDARGPKPIIAIANNLAASAGYYLASSADKVFVTPSGEVGSIGTYIVHYDWSKYLDDAGIKPTFIFAGKHKVDGAPELPLSEEAKADMQGIVDRYYGKFVADVARNRNVTKRDVTSNYGQGRVFTSEAAMEAGMVDGGGTLEQRVAAMTRAGKGRTGGNSAELLKTLEVV